jgi:hypothetical protein
VGRDGGDKQLIWVGCEEEYFRETGWTGQITLIHFDKLLRARKAPMVERFAKNMSRSKNG